MPDHAPPKLTAASIADHLGGDLVGPGDIVVTGMQSLTDAGAGDLSFVTEERFVEAWSSSKAVAALVPRDLAIEPGEGRSLIRVDNVDLAVASVLEALAPPPPLPDPGVHPSAIIEPDAEIADGAIIGAGCYVGRGASIGEGAVLHPNVTVMADSSVGAGTVLWPGVVVRERCTIGRGCIVHPNVTIGSDGFGYRPAADGKGLVKIPQIGTVRIGDGVEIGSGTCIDRGKFGATTIGDGAKLDNLVHVAHNCTIGRCAILAGQVGMAGSVTIGDGAMFGGQVGLRDHITIGAGAKIAAKAAVITDVPPGATFAGYPAKESRIAMRETVALVQLPDLIKRVKKLEQQANAPGR